MCIIIQKTYLRIPELDYMRGLAMLFVVMGHILEFGMQADSYPRAFMSIVQMPIFFMIAGFLAYKDGDESVKAVVHRFVLRTRALLVPLIVWSVLLNVCNGVVTSPLSMVYRGGYWFFLALWWCDVINTLCAYVSKKFKYSVVSDIVLYSTLYAIILIGKIEDIELAGLLPIQNVQYYFPFFALGIMCRKYPCIYSTFLNKYTYALGLITVIVGWYFSYLQSYVIFATTALGGCVVIWMACKEIPNKVKWAKALSIVGKNTLPIYAIHYLFITTLPQCLYDAVNVPMGFFLQFVIAFTYAVVVVILCLIIDRIISVNPITRMVFFGESKKREW